MQQSYFTTNSQVYHLNHGLVMMHEYVLCTSNKMVNGEEWTIQLLCDDLKAPQKKQKVLDGFLNC